MRNLWERFKKGKKDGTDEGSKEHIRKGGITKINK